MQKSGNKKKSISRIFSTLLSIGFIWGFSGFQCKCLNNFLFTFVLPLSCLHKFLAAALKQ